MYTYISTFNAAAHVVKASTNIRTPSFLAIPDVPFNGPLWGIWLLLVFVLSSIVLFQNPNILN